MITIYIEKTLETLHANSHLTQMDFWYNFYTMKFEFDSKKSATNKQKHGIDFIEAQALWDDENRIIYPTLTVDEKRFVLVGLINKKYWSAIYTMRNENIRIISVRRSRKEEVYLYEG